MHEQIPSEVSRDTFLRFFFEAVGLGMDVDEDAYDFEEIRPKFLGLAEFLVLYLLLPSKSLPQLNYYVSYLRY